MVEKELEDIYRYTKPNNKNMKDYEKKRIVIPSILRCS